MYHNCNSALKKNANWHVGSNEMLLQLSWFYRFSGSLVYFLRVEVMEPFIDYITSMSSVFCVNQPQKQHQNTPSKSTIKPTPTLIIPHLMIYSHIYPRNLGINLCWPSRTLPHHPQFELQETSYKKIPGQDMGPFFRYKAWTLGNSQKNEPPG